MIVVDSIGAMSPAIAHMSEAGANQMALVSRLLSNQLPICTALLGATQTVLVLINQERANLVTGYAAKYAPDVKAYGGYALRYHPAINAKMTRTGQVTDKNRPGFRAQMTVAKNSFNVEKRKVQWDVYYDTGVDLIQATLDFGVEVKAITTGGGYYKLGNTALNHLGNRGQLDAVARLRAEPDLYQEVYSTLISAQNASGVVTEEEVLAINGDE
jgi:recombination protein RecA